MRNIFDDPPKTKADGKALVTAYGITLSMFLLLGLYMANARFKIQEKLGGMKS